MKISNLVITLVVFVFLVSGMTMFFSGIDDNYNVTSPEIENFTEISDNIQQTAENAKEALTNNPFQGIPVLDVVYAASQSVWNVLNMFMNSIALTSTAVSISLANILFIPTWLSGLIIIVIILLFIFAFASAILRWET